MGARENFEQELARLNAVRAAPGEGEGPEALSRALAARSNLLVARAAEIIGEWELKQYVPELAAAFERFLIDGVRRDPTCAAKIALVETLNQLEVTNSDLFLRGLRHVQPEPVWGGHEDTAARLRAACALGLARSDPPDALLELAGLLADKETDARLGAIQAIAGAARPGGAPLLWFKAHIGDDETIVLYHCYVALLALEPARALPFVGGRMIDDLPARAEAAALALGASRLPQALPLLTTAWESAPETVFRRTILSAMATLADDAAFSFLLDLLADGSPSDSAAALAALAPLRNDARRERKVERVLRRRDDPADL